MEMNNYTIRDMPDETKPRERLASKGAASLSNTELLAILIQSGTTKQTALQLAEQILVGFNGLDSLSASKIFELTSRKGIGIAKASRIVAAFEIGRRAASPAPDKAKPEIVSSPADVWNLLGAEMRLLDKEYFKAIFLNTRHNVISVEDISVGSLNSSIVHPRELFKEAIRCSTHEMIVVHNHPSGNASPSRDDINLTQRLVQAGNLVGIPVIDHIIIGIDSYSSLKEQNLL